MGTKQVRSPYSIKENLAKSAMICQDIKWLDDPYKIVSQKKNDEVKVEPDRCIFHQYPLIIVAFIF